MRTLPCWVFAGMLVACGTETAPPSDSVPASGRSEVARVDASPQSGHLALPADPADPAATDSAADGRDAPPASADPTPNERARRLIRDAITAAPPEQARVPDAVRALGVAALPAVADALRCDDAGSRRLAALIVLQWADELHRQGTGAAVMPALAAARLDADPRVRAAAELAWQRATGDTSALDHSRAAHAAATAGTDH